MESDRLASRRQAEAKLAGWNSQLIETALDRAHSLQADDINGDGRLDLAMAQIHTSKEKLVRVYLQEPLRGFRRMALVATGSHKLQLGAIAGDLDVVGKNYAGSLRSIEIWINHIVNRGQKRHLQRSHE